MEESVLMNMTTWCLYDPRGIYEIMAHVATWL